MSGTSDSVRVKKRGNLAETLPRALLCPALTAVSVWALFHELWRYEPHVTDGTGPVLLSAAAIAFSFFCALRFIKRKAWGALSAALICMALSAAVLLIAWRIPLCVICQHLTKADLGLLNRWIWAPD